ncbi:MAG: cell envelope integrity protein TolA [Usitatibacter sp.]
MRAVFLALVVHAVFFALIVFGVNWQSAPPAPVEVELWANLPKVPAPPPPQEPAASPAPTPEPARPVETTPPPPKKAEDAKPVPPKPAAEINEKLERQKREREKRERDRLEQLERQKAAEAKKRDEDEARKKGEADKKKREDEKRRRDEESARREAERAREAAAAAQKSEMDRFINAIQAKIRQRANVPDTVTGNPEVHVLIRLLPGGDVLDITITKRSGNPAYDGAIERGIRSASPLPVPPANSELFPRFRELNLHLRHER